MTRSKPDQRRWSFCESVTAGVREYVKEGRKRERRGEEVELNGRDDGRQLHSAGHVWV